MNEAVVDAAYALAASRQMCCRDDIALLVEVVTGLGPKPEVVQLGAGSGTMALAIMGTRDDVCLTTVDHDPQALAWEERALRNAGVKLKRYEAWHQDSAAAGRGWMLNYTDRMVDLLVVDGNHSYHGVIRDLGAWRWGVDLIFMHDYDGTTAPAKYPGVKIACDEVWGDTPPIHKAGWSAVFKARP